MVSYSHVTPARTRVARSILALAAAAGIAAPCAAQIDSVTAAVTTQGILPDADVYLLSLATGTAGDSLQYHSEGDEISGWTGSLSGSLGGNSVSLTYFGDMSLAESGIVSWIVSGTVGPETVSGGGSVEFVASADGYQLNIASSLGVGGRSLTRSGFALGSWSPNGFEVGNGAESVTDNGALLAANYKTIWIPDGFGGYVSVWQCGDFEIAYNWSRHPYGYSVPMDQDISIVPTPGTIGLVTIAIAALRRRRAPA